MNLYTIYRDVKNDMHIVAQGVDQIENSEDTKHYKNVWAGSAIKYIFEYSAMGYSWEIDR